MTVGRMSATNDDSDIDDCHLSHEPTQPAGRVR